MDAARWHWISESTLQLSLPGPPDVLVQRRVLNLAERLRGTPGLRAAVPGLHSLSLETDWHRISPSALEQLAQAAWRRARPQRSVRRTVQLPVHYGGDAGPDLRPAASRLGLRPEQLVQAHAEPVYEVACLGFLPGFAYLLGLPPALALPRHATPRLRVPAGSVGIGGAQTGVYPLESPGGWQLIGHCPQRLFDPVAQPPNWLLPGDAVRFVPVPV